jgi:hypothetical protein
MQTEFFGKTWIYQVGAFLSALLVGLCILMAILFVAGVVQPKGVVPPNVAASRLLLISIPIAFVTLLCWSNLRARRRPLLRICREGLEVNIVGRGNLERVHTLPTSFKLAWLVMSMQGFRSQIGWVPWESYRASVVSGMPTWRTLTIHGTVAYPTFQGDEIKAAVGDHVTLHGSECRDSLKEIANTIETISADSSLWAGLPSMHDV